MRREATEPEQLSLVVMVGSVDSSYTREERRMRGVGRGQVRTGDDGIQGCFYQLCV